MFRRRLYSLSKMRHLYQAQERWYRRSGTRLSPELKGKLENLLEQLDLAIREKDRESGTEASKALEAFAEEHRKRSTLFYAGEIILALVVALVVATIVRQTWFELYEIPSGSMRPTFRERDRLIVTKTSLGLNIPLKPGHYYFNPDNVQHTGVVIWSGEEIDLPDTDSLYFGILPSKKRYIKRLIGKPGDQIYFYGGQVWGIDPDGNVISAFQDSPWMENLDYAPFGSWEGRSHFANDGNQRIVTFKHFNIPIGRIQFQPNGDIVREVWTGSEWRTEELTGDHASSAITQYGHHWGMDNYGQARLLTPSQLLKVSSKRGTAEEGAVAYLQIMHHPSLTYPEPRFAQAYSGEIFPLLTPYESVIPLQEQHLAAIRSRLYTARFVVRNGKAWRYSPESSDNTPQSAVTMRQIPDGMYEFYDGIGYCVGFGGTLIPLSDTHPLMADDTATTIQLFNLGIELHSTFDVDKHGSNTPFPSRYAYYRDGDLYVGRGPVLRANDPVLIDFVEEERDLAEASSEDRRYRPFVDAGRPTKEMILARGIAVPEKHYLVLGDNHAMSADSRIFGFVPQGNMEGSPSIIIWPWQERMGTPEQAPYPWVTLPRVVIWSLVLGLYLLWRIYRRYQDAKPFERIE